MKTESGKMKMKSLIIAVMLLFSVPAFAFEDCIITGNAPLTQIKVQNHEIIDVFPLATIMNDKNILIVHPLKEGSSKFSVVKNNKETVEFSVKVGAEETIINDVEGFEILGIDQPPNIYEYELDLPPVLE